jgi:hypothetical protein
MGRTYRTAQGKNIDLEKLKLQHELVQAVGNMRVNARGDQLGAGGEVVRAREEMIDQHYQANVAKRRNVATEDVIPTQAGKVDKPKPVPALKAKKKQPIPDPVEVEVAPEPIPDPVEVEVAPEPIPDPVASTPKGPALKGGLARAVAKTQAYENKKNKPKRI